MQVGLILLLCNDYPMQLALLASFAVTMVGVSPPLSGAMELPVDVVTAVMKGGAVS